ncbi:tRNA (adenosine(37)-N6)-threonylcarbamoyltransferase complex ATPase subunit type 1 TsaE [Stappia sediminis]|uniref:tRNA (adenosine(37)-N6)-threonylcarbamoyltransferase complex ATPase subunit type 1 TsaE n=1 Tax=Stappia sediminis TaxID=2692190 RepID=UPI0028AC3310|nr:tRNA (adenosine(37)-N6)-threonylcarbamoyltransferase complex ATPase subunit type 1 TsaE [Stappia sediminis]
MSLETLTLNCADETATRRLAEDVASILKPGDCILLVGDLGAGKSTFARATLRALAGNPALEVPSPTFTLVQTYALDRLSIAHLDLYRLEEADELDELGLDELLERGAALIEWPERAEDRLPEDALVVRIEPGERPEARSVSLSWTEGDWGIRLARSRAVRRFLDAAGWNDAARVPLQGDASTRAYETVTAHGRTAILMNAPARPDGPPVREGLPYSRLVHLAEDVRPFVAIDEGLRKAGFHAPEIFSSDVEAGLLLLEDLGREGFVKDGAPIAERYFAAVELLADLHSHEWPREAPLPDGTRHLLSPYDARALMFEAELFLDWYLPHAGYPADEGLRGEFAELWTPLLERLETAEKTWVLRDYHSPNLIWRGEEKGNDRIGLIDFQDAVIGPSAYDVASLTLDARVTVPEELEKALCARYVERRKANTPGFDEERFSQDYAIMAAQRQSKLFGIFVRLAKRDGKPRYLGHLPRIEDYFRRVARHPVLADLRLWYETHGVST